MPELLLNPSLELPIVLYYNFYPINLEVRYYKLCFSFAFDNYYALDFT
jgi:hypothetical protein